MSENGEVKEDVAVIENSDSGPVVDESVSETVEDVVVEAVDVIAKETVNDPVDAAASDSVELSADDAFEASAEQTSDESVEEAAEAPADAATDDSGDAAVEESADATVSDSSESDSRESRESIEKKSQLKGTVTRVELYGAFVDIGREEPAILHISHLGRRVNRVSDVLSVGQEVDVWVDRVDEETGQVMLTLEAPLAVEWRDLAEGNVYTGTVTRLENFGAFIDIGAEKDGLAHVSELSHEFVKHPAEVLSNGQEVEVQVLGFSRKKRRINLSLKALQEKPESAYEKMSAKEIEYEPEESFDEMPTAMEIALREAMDSNGGPARSKGKKARRNNRRRKAQEEIMNRTLSMTMDDIDS